MSKRVYNLKKDTPDERDFKYHLTHPDEIVEAAKLPKSVNLYNTKVKYVFDQAQIGSCASNAGNLAFDFIHGGGPFSRLQTYYNARNYEGSVNIDSGSTIRDVVKSLANLGVDTEVRWPYEVALYTQEPPAVIMEEALANKATTYSRLTKPSEFKSCVAAGRPFIVGISVFESFESDAVASTGIVPVPKSNEQLLGGHGVTCLGYQTINGTFYYLIQNSWGSSWGDPKNSGCCWIPAAYLENSKFGASDVWAISATI